MLLRAIAVAAWLAALPVLAQVAPPKPATALSSSASEFRQAQWEELVPKGWDPFARFKGMNLGMLSDSSPRVLQLMRELREALDNAPTVAALDGAAVKLPGYVVPLEEVKGELKEFLLVPYFGACIHTPPPPANQIIHVVAAKPVKGIRSMEAVWVSGTLKTLRGDSVMGTSGYRMEAVAVDRYVPPGRR
jgi:hypothetical protein